jgi:hypothetical protein
MDPNFEHLRSKGFNVQDPAKVPKFKYMHDGALSLSIRNFVLNQAQLIISYACQLTAKRQPKNCGTRNFLLIVVLFS